MVVYTHNNHFIISLVFYILEAISYIQKIRGIQLHSQTSILFAMCKGFRRKRNDVCDRFKFPFISLGKKKTQFSINHLYIMIISIYLSITVGSYLSIYMYIFLLVQTAFELTLLFFQTIFIFFTGLRTSKNLIM